MKRIMPLNRILFFGILLLITTGCTTSKWTVIDEHAINQSEPPAIVSEMELLIAEELPSIERPVLKLVPYSIVQREYAERVKIQRMVQKYRPKWGFSILAAAGSALAFTAANTDILMSGPSTTQRIALNSTGILLGTLAATNLRPAGDPILTDEIRYLRQTGINTKTDTVFIQQTIDQTASLTITYEGTEIFHDPAVQLSDNSVEINIGAVAAEITDSIKKESEFVVTTNFKGGENIFSIPVSSFMELRFIIENPVVQLRSSPTISQDNILAELGEGSSLKQIEVFNEQWIRVEYGSADAFIQKSNGSSRLRSSVEGGSALLVELSDIPFGEIDVENSLPVLKSRNPDDRALIISGNRNNQAGTRQFAERDERLFKYYMSTSLRMTDDQIVEISDTSFSAWQEEIQFCRNLNGGSTIVYMHGYARRVIQDGRHMFAIFHINEEGEEQFIPLRDILTELSQCTAEKLFLFIDLEYIDQVIDGRIISLTNVNGGRQQELANVLLGDFPNAFVLFSNRIGQQSSIFSGSIEDDKRHHIFTYYLAEGFKQRKTQMSALFRHLENNVDYTSRRLHDRPQEVQAFGNFMLDIAR